jgi:TPP-dependent pyruvate/acetoin dehydrogenase alpha subunit
MTTLGEDFPKQQQRCRELLEQYAECAKMPGVYVDFAVAAIKQILQEADEAAISGDLPRMIAAYEAMRGCK